MMEILEKLPGITVERYALMNRSYTFAGHETWKPKGDPLDEKQDAKFQSGKFRGKPLRHNSAAKERVARAQSDTKHENMRPRPPDRPKSRDKPVIGYHHQRPSSRSGSRIDLEVLGKNARARVAPTSDTEPPIDKKESQINEDRFPPQPPPALKSILKRTGSGVSTRSSRSVGVMSLDSGMAKLAASLLLHKNNKSNFVLSGKQKHNFSQNSNPLNGVEDGMPPELSSLPLLGFTSKQQSPFHPQQQRNDDPPTVAASPSKSVSFNLDPEKRTKDEEDKIISGPGVRKKQGDARWGVALSSHQERLRGAERSGSSERDQVPHVKSSVSKKQGGGKSHGEHNRSKSDAERSKGILELTATMQDYTNNAYSSSALLRPRPEGGITGIAGIHLMSDPYRRYLMARAAEQSQRYALENKLAKKEFTRSKSFVHSKAISDRNEATVILRRDKRTAARQSSLDRQYMFLPSAHHKHDSPVLPVLNPHGR